MSASNFITKVAIVGSGGNLGVFVTGALLKTGRHTVTAITRADSQTKLPDGVTVKRVDYDREETLIEALKGHDALVIILGGRVPHETELKLAAAASKAGVPWILPNDWSPDSTNEAVNKDVFIFPPKVATRKFIEALDNSYYISVATGFWYEWSLSMAPCYGIDLKNRTATFFDDGETKISTSTWPQVGRAVASLLSLPVRSEGTAKESACLEHFKNKVIYIKSFTINQKEMLESALRVTGTREDDWTITKEPAQERFATGLKEIEQGLRIGFAKMLYTRIFYPDAGGNLESKETFLNGLLGLPEEGIDEATKVAVERAKQPQWHEK